MSESEVDFDQVIDMLDADTEELESSEDHPGTGDLDDNDEDSITRNIRVIKVSSLSPAERRKMMAASRETSSLDRVEARSEIAVNRQSSVIGGFNLLFQKMSDEVIESHFDSIRNWLDIELGLDWKTTVLRTVERLERKGMGSVAAERRVLLGMASIVAECSAEELETLQDGVKLHKDLQKMLSASEGALN